jgi:hypothetical protein
MRKRRRYKSGNVKRAERKKRREKQRAEFVAANPTPYEGWADESALLLATINRAYQENGGAAAHNYHPNAKAVCRLSIVDLAATLFAVERVGWKGLSIGQILKCYERCGVGKSRAKAASALAALVELGLIKKTAFYSSGKHGNVYELGRQARPLLRKYPPTPKPTADDAAQRNAAADDEPPF